jgi:hypothetical protein
MKRLTTRALNSEAVRLEGMEVVFDEKASLFPVDVRDESGTVEERVRDRRNGSGNGH